MTMVIRSSENRRKPRTGVKGILTPIGDVLQSLLSRLAMPEDAADKGRVFLAWEKIAGDAASKARPFRFRGSTLIVEVLGPAWMTELAARKTDLIRRIDRAVGRGVVTDIRFQLKKPSDVPTS